MHEQVFSPVESGAGALARRFDWGISSRRYTKQLRLHANAASLHDKSYERVPLSS